MQWAFFRIPAAGGGPAEDFNRFLSASRVLTVHREFVNHGDGSFWALAVEYLVGEQSSPTSPVRREAPSRVDYKSLLSPDDFALFARLREWRKARAETEATPVYTIFADEQLAEIARRRCSTLAALAETASARAVWTNTASPCWRHWQALFREGQTMTRPDLLAAIACPIPKLWISSPALSQAIRPNPAKACPSATLSPSTAPTSIWACSIMPCWKSGGLPATCGIWMIFSSLPQTGRPSRPSYAG